MSRREALAICIALALGLVLVAASLAAEQTRETYKVAVEPICQKNREASDRYLKGVRKLVKDEKLKKAGENFTKAAAALEKAQKQLAAVEQPPADSAKLDNWLQGIEGQVAQMRTIAAKLRAGKTGAASSLSVRLTHDATTTNNQVIVFGFNYCKIDPSRYT
jgi:multidrug resistance efflux pump